MKGHAHLSRIAGIMQVHGPQILETQRSEMKKRATPSGIARLVDPL